jgi:hypothetical protein
MPVSSSQACPNCGASLPPSPQSACSKCGFSLAAGLVRRDLPHQTRGIDAIARKFGAKWSFACAALMIFVSAIYFDDITTAETTGKSFSADSFSGILYTIAGKWAVIVFWLALSAVFVAAGIRARRAKATPQT